MTETPHQAPPGQSASGGWNTEHLRDYRALRRSRVDRKVAGVAGGLGRHLDVDPTVLRVLLVVLAFFGGAGILLYGAAWLVVPEEGTEDALVHTSASTRNAVLVGAGVVAALLVIGDTADGWGFPWPLAVVGIVITAVVLSARSRAGARPEAAPEPVPTHQAAWGPPYGPAAFTAGGSVPPGMPVPPVDPFMSVPPVPPAAAYPPVPGRRRGPLLFGPTLAVVALALGALGLYDASGGAVADAAYPALALAVLGCALVLGAFVGRPGGLVVLAVLAAVALPATELGRPSYGGERDLRLRPATAAQLQDGYDVPAGRIDLDLTAVRDPQDLDGRSLSLRASAGELVVVVPADLAVHYTAHVAYGGVIDTPDGQRGGWGASAEDVVNPGAPTRVDLDLDLSFGHIEVVTR